MTLGTFRSSLTPLKKLRCIYKSLRVAPQAFDPPNPPINWGAALKVPLIKGDLGGSIHILYPAKRCVYSVALKRGQAESKSPNLSGDLGDLKFLLPTR
jgi:hypothetical protein